MPSGVWVTGPGKESTGISGVPRNRPTRSRDAPSPPDFRRGQRLQFLLAAFLQPRPRLAQFGTAPPGMAHQLRAALGQHAEQFHQLRGAKPPRDLESCEVVGRPAAVLVRTRWNRRRMIPSASLVSRFSRGTVARSAFSGKSNGRRTQRMSYSCASRRPRRAPAAQGACACVCRDALAGCPRRGSGGPAPPAPRTAGSPALRAPPAVAARSPGTACPLTSDLPPISTRWQPMSSVGVSRARPRALSKASPFAISVVAVRMPSRCASTMPWFTSPVKPKSSALTTSCFRALKTGPAGSSGTSSGWRACPWPAIGTRASLRSSPRTTADSPAAVRQSPARR